MNRFDEMDMDLDAMHDDVRVDEEILGFVEEEVEEEVFSKFSKFWRVWFKRWSTFKNWKYETLKTKFLKFPNFCFGLKDGLKFQNDTKMIRSIFLVL